MQKRTASLFLALIIILSAFSLTSFKAAADGMINVVSAVKDRLSATYTLTFSEPVHIFDSGYVWLRKTNPVNGTSQVGSPTINYVGSDTTTVGDDLYSSVVTLAFTSVPADCGDNYGVTFVEYFLNDTNAGAIAPSKICGADGKMVAGNYVSGGLDFLWIPTDTSDPGNSYGVHIEEITIIHIVSAVKRRNAAFYTLTFSEPVHIFDNGYVWLRKTNPANGTSQVGSPTVNYVGSDATTVGDDLYSSVVTLSFSSVPADCGDNYGITFVEYFLSDTNTAAIAPSKISGIGGKLVDGNYVSGGLDFLWIPTDTSDPGNSYGVHIEPEPEPVSVMSARFDPSTGIAEFTFSEPMHVFKTGYIWLCTVPTPHGGYDQYGVAGVEYAGVTQTVGGNVYSNTVRINFGKHDFIFSSGDSVTVPATELGVRFVEYGETSYLNDGLVAETVIKSVDGVSLGANFRSGTVDICWIPCEEWAGAMSRRGLTGTYIDSNVYATVMSVAQASVASAEVTSVSAGVIELTFDRKVKVTDASLLSSLTLGDAAAVSCASVDGSEYSYTYVASFGTDVTGKTALSVPAGMFTDEYGVPLTTGTLSGTLAQFAPAPLSSVTAGIESGAKYNFMNCDTGRSIVVGGKDEFTLVYDGASDKYCLMDGESYVNLATLSLQAVPYTFKLICDNDYERYQIAVNGGTLVLRDTDGGSTTSAVIDYYPYGNVYIETGWYITRHGDQRPKKFACVGDSITCGVIPNADSDGTGVKPGYRKELSQMLLAEYGRVVFVGSLKHAAGGNTTAITNTTINDGFLYRHEGHSGWVIHNQGSYTPSADDNNRGIDDDGVYLLKDGVTEEERHVRRILQEKYAPDVIFMMIGINDVGMSGAYDGNDTKLTAIAGRWETLVDNVLADLPDGGKLYAATILPRTNGSGEWNTSQNAAISALNDKYKAIINAKISAGCESIVLADNYAYVYAAGTSTISSDLIHPSIAGYTALAESYFAAYTANTVTECGAGLSWRVEDGALTISGAGGMDDFASQTMTPWSGVRSSVTSVTIGADVTSIGAYALADMASLTDVYVMGNPSVEEYALEGAAGVTVHAFTGTDAQAYCTANSVAFEMLDEFDGLGFQIGNAAKNKFRVIAQMRYSDVYTSAGYEVAAVGSDGFGHDFNKFLDREITTVYKTIRGTNALNEVVTAAVAADECYLSCISISGLPAMNTGASIVFTFRMYVTSPYSNDKVYTDTVTLAYDADGVRQYVSGGIALNDSEGTGEEIDYALWA